MGGGGRVNDITPQRLIEALTKFKEECHSNMEGCDLYEFLYWERGMTIAYELEGYILRDNPELVSNVDIKF